MFFYISWELMHFDIDTNQGNVKWHATCRKRHKWPDERKQIKKTFPENLGYFQVISSFLSADRLRVHGLPGYDDKPLSRKPRLVDLNSWKNIYIFNLNKQTKSWISWVKYDVSCRQNSAPNFFLLLEIQLFFCNLLKYFIFIFSLIHLDEQSCRNVRFINCQKIFQCL